MKKPVGFEGSAFTDWGKAIIGDAEPDDPSFRTLAEIARAEGMSEKIVTRWIREHPDRVEFKVVWRQARGRIKVYRLKP